jgi:hypothetical protein
MNQELVIKNPRFQATSQGTRVAIRLETPRGSFELFYEINGSSVAQDATACLAGLLPLAMRNHWDLTSDAPVSEKLLQALQTIQGIYRLWDKSTQHINVHALKTVACPPPGPREAASFFSGGVDAWYTALKNRDTVKNLIFITGFDIPLDNADLGTRILEQIRLSARETGRHLIEVRTNLREFSDQFMPWGLYHGAALASVGLWLAPRCHTVLIPATHHYGDIFPWGSHPLLDPLWSTELVQLANDGCEATRFMKMALLAKHPEAVRRLRVCYNNRKKFYNCGRCEKCLRAKVSLYALGKLQECATLDARIPLKDIAKLRLGDYSVVGNFTRSSFVKDNLEALRHFRRDDPALTRALRRALRRPGIWTHARRFARKVLPRSTLLQNV